MSHGPYEIAEFLTVVFWVNWVTWFTLGPFPPPIPEESLWVISDTDVLLVSRPSKAQSSALKEQRTIPTRQGKITHCYHSSLLYSPLDSEEKGNCFLYAGPVWAPEQ